MIFDREKFLKEVSPTFSLKLKLKGGDLPFAPHYMTQAKKNVILRRLDLDSQFAQAWSFNYSEIFYNDMAERLNNQSNMIIRCYGDPNCMTGDTRVLLEDGSYKPIKELCEEKIKRKVLSVRGKDIIPKRIINFYKTEKQPIIEITTLSNKKIKCTYKNPLLKTEIGLWVGEWKEAQDLKVGELIAIYIKKRKCVRYEQITKIRKLPPEETYDIEVEDTHNFIANDIVTKNSGKSYASIYLLQLQREYFGFNYHIVFSKTEAASLLASETYKAKHDELAGKFTILLDEDYKRFGIGSMQENEYFQSMQEFLRRAQINMIMNNPYDISNAEVQLEVIGYTIPNDKGESFTKSIVYYLTDKRNKIYSPMGYVITRRPSLPYVDAYTVQKDRFLKNFSSNKSPVMEKNKSLLEIIYNSMDVDTKEMVRQSILLGKDNDTRTLLSEAIGQFNMPSAYTKSLVESFKWLYYPNEIKQAWEAKKARIEARMQ